MSPGWPPELLVGPGLGTAPCTRLHLFAYFSQQPDEIDAVLALTFQVRKLNHGVKVLLRPATRWAEAETGDTSDSRPRSVPK